MGQKIKRRIERKKGKVKIFTNVEEDFTEEEMKKVIQIEQNDLMNLRLKKEFIETELSKIDIKETAKISFRTLKELKELLDKAEQLRKRDKLQKDLKITLEKIGKLEEDMALFSKPKEIKYVS